MGKAGVGIGEVRGEEREQGAGEGKAGVGSGRCGVGSGSRAWDEGGGGKGSREPGSGEWVVNEGTDQLRISAGGTISAASTAMTRPSILEIIL